MMESHKSHVPVTTNQFLEMAKKTIGTTLIQRIEAMLGSPSCDSLEMIVILG
jgi:hypothetical protein